MKPMKVKLNIWIVCAVFVCYSVGFVQETGPHHSTSNVNTTLSAKHFGILNLRPKSARPESWEEENDTDLPTDDGVTDSDGIINNPEAISTQSDDKFRVKRASAPFRCLAIKKGDKPKTSHSGREAYHCIKRCWSEKKNLALLKKGDLCSCTNNAKNYKSADISNCNTRCFNKASESCGGENHFSEYKTGYIKEPRFTKYNKHKLHLTSFGCKLLVKKPKVTAINRLITMRMTPSMCLEYCIYRRFKFATLYHRTTCQCFADLKGFFSNAKKEKCDQPCGGDGSSKCGGPRLRKEYYNIYGTDFKKSQKTKKDQRFEDKRWMEPNIDKNKLAFFKGSTAKKGNNNGRTRGIAQKSKGPVALLLVNTLAFYCIVL